MLEAGEIFAVQGVQRPPDHSRGGSSVPGEDEVSWKGIAYYLTGFSNILELPRGWDGRAKIPRRPPPSSLIIPRYVSLVN